jgi:hypothetical protein
MPGIISLLREATSPDLTTQRGKAMECAGLIGEAVGVQVFAADAMEIMQLFMTALVSASSYPLTAPPLHYVNVCLSQALSQPVVVTNIDITSVFAATGRGARYHVRLHLARLRKNLARSDHTIRTLSPSAHGAATGRGEAGDSVHNG